MKKHEKQLISDIQLFFAATYAVMEILTLLFCPQFLLLPRKKSKKKQRHGCMIEDIIKYGLILAS